MTTVLLRGALLLCALAAPGAAQQVGPMVASDLNGDGQAERFALIDSGYGTVNLRIENTGGGVILAEDIAWLEGFGQKPGLSLAENGSVQLSSMNDSGGGNLWHLTLTIAYRDGACLIAGFAGDWRDSLEPEDTGKCDMDFLTGEGVLVRGNPPARKSVRELHGPWLVTEWKSTTQFPYACELTRQLLVCRVKTSSAEAARQSGASMYPAPRTVCR